MAMAPYGEFGCEPLTRSTLATLQSYAANHGRYWKASLVAEWLTDTVPATLRRLATSHGSYWLARFELTNIP